MINEELINAYRKTEYCIFKPAIVIKIGELSESLDELLKQYDQQDWTFISACNPYSKILSDTENNERHLHLKEAMKAYKYFEGEGIGEDLSWKPEKSLLVIGINRENAIEVGRHFKQNAIVIGEVGKPAALKLLM